MSQQVARPTRDMDGSTSEIPDGMVDKVKYYVNKLRNADNETWGKVCMQLAAVPPAA